MKDAILIVTVVVLMAGIIFAAMYGMRMFSNATTPITLHTPKPGITCAAMVTGDGAAISCWKD